MNQKIPEPQRSPSTKLHCTDGTSEAQTGIEQLKATQQVVALRPSLYQASLRSQRLFLTNFLEQPGGVFLGKVRQGGVTGL